MPAAPQVMANPVKLATQFWNVSGTRFVKILSKHCVFSLDRMIIDRRVSVQFANKHDTVSRVGVSRAKSGMLGRPSHPAASATRLFLNCRA